jgi:hypothetical protein
MSQLIGAHKDKDQMVRARQVFRTLKINQIILEFHNKYSDSMKICVLKIIVIPSALQNLTFKLRIDLISTKILNFDKTLKNIHDF